MAAEDGGGPLHPDVAAERGQTLRPTGQIMAITGTLLPTPEAKLASSGPDYARADRDGAGGDDLITTVHKHLLPTPNTAAASGGNARRGGARGEELLLPGIAEKLALMPTPNASMMNYDEDPEQFHARRAQRKIKDGNNGGGVPLGIAAQEAAIDWGEYEPAIRRTEAVLGRPCPPPAIPDGRGGRMRLSAAFEEWMMLLPEGYVTDPALGLTREEQIKAIGNMVCPPQAAAAVRAILLDLGDDVIWPEPTVTLTGITFEPSRGTWRAKAHRGGRWHHIGRYPTAEQAAEARRAWLEARA